MGKSNQSRSRWTFDRVQKLDTNTVTKLGESHWYKFPSPLQVTTSSLRPSTCRRTISWWSKMTGRPCFPSTYLTNHPPVPTTTMWGRIQWSGSMRFPIRMKGGHCAVLPLPWSHMSYLKTGGLWTDCGWSFSYVCVLWVLLAENVSGVQVYNNKISEFIFPLQILCGILAPLVEKTKPFLPKKGMVKFNVRVIFYIVGKNL